MNRSVTKHIILFILIVGSTIEAQAQNKYQVIPWHRNTTLYKYLMQQVNQQYHERMDSLSIALESRDSMLRYRNLRRERYLRLLGKLPAKTDLHTEVTGTIQRNGYKIEKVIYQSFPHHHVTANLYIPDGKGPFPGVLFFCGHEMTAKATKSYQKTAILFAKYGFVTLVIDPISQGERLQLTNKSGKNLTRGATTGHTLLDAGANLVGTSVTAYQLWDNVQGLNFLRSLPMIDTTRIGCIGNSGGGTQSTYFMAYEPKIKVASECSFVTRRERTYETIGPQDGCQWLPYEGREYLDEGDFLIMHAPKPLLMLAANYDFFSFIGTRATYRKLKEVYRTLGIPQKIHMFAWSDGHGISKPKREEAVTWFRRWFYGDTTHVKEGNLQILSEKQLNCTRSGQVNSSFSNEIDVQQHNWYIADTLRNSRKEFRKDHSHQAYLNKIRKTIGVPAHENKTIHIENRGNVSTHNYSIHKILIRRSGQPPIPVLFMLPGSGRKIHKTIVWFPEKGKASIADSASLMNQYWKDGDAVILADMRGMGETKDPARFNSSKYYNHEYRDAAISLHIGRPLIGQRMEDVVTIMDFVHDKKRLNRVPVVINATGTAAPPVLYAAVFNHQITKVNLYKTIKSYEYIVRHPLMHDSFSYVVPGVLKYYDLPDLVRLAGKNRVSFVQPINKKSLLAN